MKTSFINVLAGLILVFGIGMLHSPPTTELNAIPASEISCQVKLKRDCCEGGGWKCCGGNGCKVSADGCESFPSEPTEQPETEDPQ